METLAQLNGFTAADFEGWLAQRFRDFYADGASARVAFDFRDLGVAAGDSTLDTLTGLYARLAPNSQRQFVGALENLLRHTEPDTFPLQGIRDILFVVGLIRAFAPVLAFAPVFGNGVWGERHPELLYDAISVLVGLEPAIEAYTAARDLVSTKNFDDRYAFDVCTILVRCRPERWVDDVNFLHERFARFAASVAETTPEALPDLAEREQQFARDLADDVSLDVLAAGLARLPLVPPSDVQWLLSRLFGSGGPLSLIGNLDSQDVRVQDEADAARHAKLDHADMSGALSVVCSDLNLMKWQETASASDALRDVPHAEELLHHFEQVTPPERPRIMGAG
jgi:hypothetical protein